MTVLEKLHPAATDSENELLSWAARNAIARPTPPINGNHRYVIEDPRLGEAKTWTRMSGLAKTLDDATALTKWEKDNVTRGYLANPDLLTGGGFESLRDRTTAAGKWGGDYLKADLGTAVHTALEVWMATGVVPDIPAPWSADLAAIVDALTRHGIVPDANWVEAVMVYPEVGAAGRLDLCARGPWGDVLRVVDLKTGRLDFGVGSWAAQLAGYARAPWRWTPEGIVEAPARDTHRGIILHAPLGEGTCHVYALDLDQGHEILTHAHRARQIRSGNDRLLVPHTAPTVRESRTVEPVGNPDTFAEPSHISEALEGAVEDLEARTDAWIIGRLRVIKDHPSAVATVSTSWPTGVAFEPPWTADERALITPVIAAGERLAEAPFPPESPDTPPPAPLYEPTPKMAPTSTTVSAAACDALKASFSELPAERVMAFRGWMAQGVEAGVDWQPNRPDGTAWGVREYSIVNAVHECLVHLWDDDNPDALTRAALGVVLGDYAVQPIHATGAVLGSLDPDEAKRLARIAVAFGRDDTATVQRLGTAVVAVA